LCDYGYKGFYCTHDLTSYENLETVEMDILAAAMTRYEALTIITVFEFEAISTIVIGLFKDIDLLPLSELSKVHTLLSICANIADYNVISIDEDVIAIFFRAMDKYLQKIYQETKKIQAYSNH
jgi:hypothetical protein